MPQIKMCPASTRMIKASPVIATPTDEPLNRGTGGINYVCAGCDRVIAQNIAPGESRTFDSSVQAAAWIAVLPDQEQSAVQLLSHIDPVATHFAPNGGNKR
jgi:hypothetical protein